MLIITADDYGKTRLATDNILGCFLRKRITSASAMVFMEDSERAAALAAGTDLEVGLHLNFTLRFSSWHTPSNLREHQNRLVSYLADYKLSQVIYNPFLTTSFNFVFRSQQEEFLRLYGRSPAYYNGHHHMHLCANMLASKMLPAGARVRRTFTFNPGEKNSLNRLYRRILDFFVLRKFISTDFFFCIAPVRDYDRLRNIVDCASLKHIEIEVHPENDEENEFLHSDKFQNLINSAPIGCFRHILKNNPREDSKKAS
jgi:predicted glycoside hydrolase/deacetylase ChbG (UPF0249 family)